MGGFKTKLYRKNQLSAMETFELMASLHNPKFPLKTPLNKQPILELKPLKEPSQPPRALLNICSNFTPLGHFHANSSLNKPQRFESYSLNLSVICLVTIGKPTTL